MATFHAGQKTHPGVPPQHQALELDSADNPGIRDETGVERQTAPGVEHMREETPGSSPGARGVTSNLTAREKGRESHPYVFVLDKNGKPLQPCTSARARKLIKNRTAVVHRRTPFVIRHRFRTLEESQVDGVELGIDPGSKHTGMAVFTTQAGERRGRYAIQLDHRGATIHKKMGQRAAYRTARRSRNLRYRPPRFLNRARPDGWLGPSLRHRVVTTVSWTTRLAKWAPVRHVHVERVAFDTHALSASQPMERTQYQQGTLAGTNVREYLLTKWEHWCAYCGKTKVPLNIEHIHPRSLGGSDRVSNLAIACIPCNENKGNKPVRVFLKNKPKLLATILAQAEAPLKNLDAITETVTMALVAKCIGRGTHTRTRTDKYGFPRLRMPRQKQHFGFQTGDLVTAAVPTGAKTGTHTGHVAVRTTGFFNVTTAHRTVQGIHHRHVRLLQRADGYAYFTQKEGRACSMAQ